MKNNKFTQLFAMRFIAFTLMTLGLNACYVGPSMNCVLLICWDGEDSDSEDNSYPTPVTVPSSYPTTDLSEYHQWIVPLVDLTSTKPNNGLRINAANGDFIKNRNGDGGHLLVEIASTSAVQSCSVKLHALIDNVEVVTTEVYPYASESFLPETLGTSCLSTKAEDGTDKALAVFELSTAPKSIQLQSFDFVTPSEKPVNSITSRGNRVTISVTPYSNKMKISISAATGDNNSVTPLYFKGFVTGTPFDLKNNYLFEELEIDPEMKNFKRDEDKNTVTYEYTIKNVGHLVYNSSMSFRVTSVRTADQ